MSKSRSTSRIATWVTWRFILISPSGRQVELFAGVGGQYNDFQNLTLSDNATRSIGSIGFNDLPYTGTWKPEGLLGASHRRGRKRYLDAFDF